MPITRGFRKKKSDRILITDAEKLRRDMEKMMRIITGNKKFKFGGD
jgi:L-rhamnose isomerase